jgi:hypothetical protein
MHWLAQQRARCSPAKSAGCSSDSDLAKKTARCSSDLAKKTARCSSDLAKKTARCSSDTSCEEDEYVLF